MILTAGQLELLEDCADGAGLNFRREYSGRGMMDYGTMKSRTCIGVTGTMSDFILFIILVTEDDPQFARELRYPGTDADGRDTIWYWRELEAPK